VNTSSDKFRSVETGMKTSGMIGRLDDMVLIQENYQILDLVKRIQIGAAHYLERTLQGGFHGIKSKYLLKNVFFSLPVGE
jgi:hypothetical protein